MNCPVCKNEIEVISQEETAQYKPVNLKLNSRRDGFNIPFSCSLCHSLKFNYTPARDVLFVWPYPRPTQTQGGIHLVDEKFIGGSYVDELAPDRAIVLAIGPGYFDKKKHRFVPTHSIEIGDVVRYNKKVPWKIELRNDNGEKFPVTLCGFADCYAVE